MQVRVIVAVWPAVTVAVAGDEHGGCPVLPPETWYRPGGSGTEKDPEAPAVTETGRCPAALNVTVPARGRSPGCWPPGPSGPPSMTSFPAM